MKIPKSGLPLISGHRGYKELEIENTANAFSRSIKENIDFIEFDVRRTKDGVPVVFHDLYLMRLLSVNRNIHKTTIKELKSYHYKDGQEVLTLVELLEMAAGKIKLMLEIKSAGIERQIIDLLHMYDMKENTIIQSFSGKTIRHCYSIDRSFEYGLCIGLIGNTDFLGNFTRFHAIIAAMNYFFIVRPYPVSWINVDGPLVTNEFMKLCIQNGKRVILGSQKTWNYLYKLDEWRVEIVNVNNPGYFKQLLSGRVPTT